MLCRLTTPNGLAFYRSPLLHSAKVPHAFSTRLGGVSPPPFDSLNLGNPSGCDIQDDSAHVAENYRRLLAAVGCSECMLCGVHQVHGRDTVILRSGEHFDEKSHADALITDDPARGISVRVADCVPILIASRDGRCVAAVHAGWRGVVANVVGAAIEQMGRLGHDDFVAAIGPCISGEAYEVGAEVADQFRRAFATPPVRNLPGGKAMIDLRAAVSHQLIHAGLKAEWIDTTDLCTFRDKEEFFSHRREQGRTGRLAAVIGCRAR